MNDAVPGTEIDAEDFNELVTDIESALTASIAADGQTTATQSIPFAAGITYPGSGKIDSSGKLGIGMTPANILDITQNQNASSVVGLLNNSAGTAALGDFALSNGTASGQFILYGTGYTTAGVHRQNGAEVFASGAGGLTLNTGSAQPVYVGVNNSEVAQFTAAGLTMSAGALKEKVSALSDGATPALNAALGNIFTLSAAGDRTIAVPSNATAGQKIVIAHTASGGARTLALNTGAGGFRFGSDITALSITASGKTDYIGAIYNGTASFWDIVAVVKGY